MKLLKAMSKSVLLGLLCVTLIIGAVACNVDSTVTLVGNLAANFLNSCGAFTSNPVDRAACAAAGTAIKAMTSEIVTTHDAYVQNKSAGTLAALKAAISAAVTQVPQILAALRISNSGTLNLITLGINLVISTIQIIASSFGVASPLLSARMHAALPNVKSEKDIRSTWNTSVCGGLTGSALAGCIVN